MATTDDSGLWPTYRESTDPACSGDDGQAEEWAEVETGSYPDLAAIRDAFDTDDAEPEPEYGDFWQDFEDEEQ
jgi:hypothetical protein